MATSPHSPKDVSEPDPVKQLDYFASGLRALLDASAAPLPERVLSTLACLHSRIDYVFDEQSYLPHRERRHRPDMVAEVEMASPEAREHALPTPSPESETRQEEILPSEAHELSPALSSASCARPATSERASSPPAAPSLFALKACQWERSREIQQAAPTPPPHLQSFSRPTPMGPSRSFSQITSQPTPPPMGPSQSLSRSNSTPISQSFSQLPSRPTPPPVGPSQSFSQLPSQPTPPPVGPSQGFSQQTPPPGPSQRFPSRATPPPPSISAMGRVEPAGLCLPFSNSRITPSTQFQPQPRYPMHYIVPPAPPQISSYLSAATQAARPYISPAAMRAAVASTSAYQSAHATTSRPASAPIRAPSGRPQPASRMRRPRPDRHLPPPGNMNPALPVVTCEWDGCRLMITRNGGREEAALKAHWKQAHSGALKAYMDAHVVTQGGRQYVPCGWAGCASMVLASTRTNYDGHVKRRHLVTQMFVCDRCPKEVLALAALIKHRLHAHGLKAGEGYEDGDERAAEQRKAGEESGAEDDDDTTVVQG